MEQTYRILNKILRISADDLLPLPDSFARFRCFSPEYADVVIRIARSREAHSCYGIRYLSDGCKTLKNVFFSGKDSRHLLYTFADDYSEFHLQTDGNCTEEILSELLMTGFYSYMSLHESLLLHASAVCHRGKAVLFTAASGVGKTTQAELWQKYRNAVILNGDKMFLTKDSGKITAWGSPWNGSSPYAENTGAEPAAIVVLEQGKENRIRKLSGMEVLQNLLPHIFFPNWDERCESAVPDLLNEILERTDVYLLRCLPDEDAVALTEKTIFG